MESLEVAMVRVRVRVRVNPSPNPDPNPNPNPNSNPNPNLNPNQVAMEAGRGQPVTVATDQMRRRLYTDKRFCLNGMLLNPLTLTLTLTLTQTLSQALTLTLTLTPSLALTRHVPQPVQVHDLLAPLHHAPRAQDDRGRAAAAPSP